ncbi:hypothetical protein AB0C65_38530 [Nocardia sp. NPDC048505]|uniref:hypothetical protein n=1 Tax=Nocardia sp. NPDC048505 TaxID=3155756 RepID=UPI0033F3E963
MATLHDPILGDVEIEFAIEHFIVIVDNLHSNATREVIVANTHLTATAGAVEDWVADMLDPCWHVRRVIPIIASITIHDHT